MALILPRSVFFHIPKTGGVWVRQAVARAGLPAFEHSRSGRNGDPHGSYRQVDTRGRFLFAFVRHPLEWYRSFWSYRMLTGWQCGLEVDRCMSVDFNRFMRRVLREHPGWLSRFYESYVGPAPGVLNFVGRTESLGADLVRALRLAGEEFAEDRLRATPPVQVSAIRPTLDPELQAAALRSERETLLRFGYEEGRSG